MSMVMDDDDHDAPPLSVDTESPLQSQLDAVVGQRIRDLRIGAGFSELAFSQSIGVTTEDLLSLEAGKQRVTPRQLVKIATTLNESVASFFRKQTEY